MTTHKRVISALGLIAALLLSSPTQALDAAGLYIERTCIACHGAEGRVPVMDEYPRIAGQNAPYLLAQMKQIKDGTRSNSSAQAMKNVMHLINEEEMAIIAEWLAGLPE